VHAVAYMVCGRCRLWPIWFVADIVVSRSDATEHMGNKAVMTSMIQPRFDCDSIAIGPSFDSQIQ